MANPDADREGPGTVYKAGYQPFALEFAGVAALASMYMYYNWDSILTQLPAALATILSK